MPDEEPVATIEGDRGAAEIFEVWRDGRLIEYRVRFDGEEMTCSNLGEAYIVAGEKTGAHT
jgi:hypothetical protein